MNPLCARLFRTRLTLSTGLLLALLCLFGGKPAEAQVLDRYFPANIAAYRDFSALAAPAQPDSAYAPLGVWLGSIVLNAQAGIAISYDTNPLDSGTRQGSVVIENKASVTANTNWARDAIGAAFTVDHSQFLSNGHDSFTDWTASAGGVIDWADDRIALAYEHIHAVSLPTDADSFGLHQAVLSNVEDFRLSDTIGGGRITLVPAVVADLYRFSAGPGDLQAGSNNSFDRNAVTGSLTGAWSFAGGHNLVAIISNSVVDYASTTQPGRPADYDDISGLIGVEYRQSGLFTYRALAGYEERVATSSGTTAATIGAPAAELDVIASPTPWDTVTLSISQSLQDEANGDAQSLTETKFGLAIDYALRRNVLLHAGGHYTRATYPDRPITQGSVGSDFEANWTLSRRFVLSATYDYAQIDAAANELRASTRHQIGLQLTVRL